MEKTERPDNDSRLHRSGRRIPSGLDEPTILAVVNDFYGEARRDPLLGPIFNRVIPDPEWSRHMAIIADFWSSMLLGTGRYAGRPMPKHLAIPELGDAHFVRWLALFRSTVERLCSPEAAALFIDRSERIAQSFRLGLATHRGEDSTAVKPLRTSPITGVGVVDVERDR